jgi:hypothetical protein
MADCDPGDCTTQAAEPLTDRDLAALFTGDRDSLGYYHPALVRELCRRMKPPSAQAVYSLLYDVERRGQLPSVAADAIDEGYAKWRSESAVALNVFGGVPSATGAL